MTGEITLRGKVLPVGGIKDKVLAAYRSGIREVVLPVENEKDLEDIPEDVRKEMQFHLVKADGRGGRAGPRAVRCRRRPPGGTGAEKSNGEQVAH